MHVQHCNSSRRFGRILVILFAVGSVIQPLSIIAANVPGSTNQVSYAEANNLGHPSTTPADRPLRKGWLERHNRYCARAAQGGVDLVFLGDSLTQRWEGAPAVWQKYYGRRNAVQMGIDNDGTQQILWRLDHGTLDGIQPKLIVLLIGINNLGNDNATPEQVCKGVAAILERICKKLPRTKVLVIGVLPCDSPGVNRATKIKATNSLLAQLADGKTVDFLDIGDQLLVDGKVNPEIQPDGTHLSAKGYAIYAEAIESRVHELMN
ncbi:MAG: GDSL-type esterase/lipase family protein [Kiritimatiellaeota bacterium]|nr:GDSL-type esterase/lipase family protein [Kiritimatiellota bacterium]